MHNDKSGEIYTEVLEGPCVVKEVKTAHGISGLYTLKHFSYLDQEKNRSLSCLAIFILDFKLSLYFLSSFFSLSAPHPFWQGGGLSLRF